MCRELDFIAYGTASALYFGKAFFPTTDALMGTLLAFVTLGVGFLMRPIGGTIGGYLGDRYGRKPVLVGALLTMGHIRAPNGRDFRHGAAVHQVRQGVPFSEVQQQLGHARIDTTSIYTKLANSERRAMADRVQW